MYHNLQVGRWVFGELSPVDRQKLLGRPDLDVHLGPWAAQGGRSIPRHPPRQGIPCAQAVALKALAILQTHMVLLFFLFVLLITYSETETPFLFCCTQLHPLNTPDKSISAAPFTLVRGRGEPCLKDISKRACWWQGAVLVQKSGFAAASCQPLPSSPIRAGSPHHPLPCAEATPLTIASHEQCSYLCCSSYTEHSAVPRLEALNTYPNPWPPCSDGRYGDLLLASCAPR